jgi:3-methylcrotonyl-CoA carboxylase alpha subunit
LVEWQLRVADGEPLPKHQDELRIDGCAMEARLYAENPTAGFLPSTGSLRRLRLPSGVRVDSGVEEGSEVTGFYDPMLAKLIVHAPTREAAARRLREACAAVQVWPVRTNAAFLTRVAGDSEFIAEHIDTGFIERRAATLIPAATPDEPIVQAAARALLGEASRGDSPDSRDTRGPWSSLVGFRANLPAYTRVDVVVGDAAYERVVGPPMPPAERISSGEVVSIDGQRLLFQGGEAWPFGPPTSDRHAGSATVSDGALRSPMPGRIVSLSVTRGQSVKQGQPLLALEAMKMEHSLIAPFDGSVAELYAAIGDQVAENVVLVRIAQEG